jgi:hypothetical protein
MMKIAGCECVLDALRGMGSPAPLPDAEPWGSTGASEEDEEELLLSTSRQPIGHIHEHQCKSTTYLPAHLPTYLRDMLGHMQAEGLLCVEE